MAATTFSREATVIADLDEPYPLVTGFGLGEQLPAPAAQRVLGRLVSA